MTENENLEHLEDHVLQHIKIESIAGDIVKIHVSNMSSLKMTKTNGYNTPTVWDSNKYELSYVVDNLPLPQTVQVAEGTMISDEIFISSLTVLTLHGVKTITKLMGHDEDGRETCIPVNCRNQVKIISNHPHASQASFHKVKDICNNKVIPRYVRTNREFTQSKAAIRPGKILEVNGVEFNKAGKVKGLNVKFANSSDADKQKSQGVVLRADTIGDFTPCLPPNYESKSFEIWELASFSCFPLSVEFLSEGKENQQYGPHLGKVKLEGVKSAEIVFATTELGGVRNALAFPYNVPLSVHVTQRIMRGNNSDNKMYSSANNEIDLQVIENKLHADPYTGFQLQTVYESATLQSSNSAQACKAPGGKNQNLEKESLQLHSFSPPKTSQRTSFKFLSAQTEFHSKTNDQHMTEVTPELPPALPPKARTRHRLEVSTNMANHSSMAISGPTQAVAVKDQDNSFQKLTSLSFPPKPQSAPLKSITKQTELVLEEGNQNVAKTKMNSPPRVYPQERTRHLSEAHTADHNRTAQSRPSKAKAPVVDDQDDDSFPDPPSFIFDLTPQRTPLMSVSSQKDSFPYEDSQNVATSTSEMLLTVTSPTATKHLSEPTTFTTSHSVVSQVPVVDDQTDSLPDPPAFILTPTPQRTPLIPISRQTGLFFSGENQVIAKMISELPQRHRLEVSTNMANHSSMAISGPTQAAAVKDQDNSFQKLTSLSFPPKPQSAPLKSITKQTELVLEEGNQNVAKTKMNSPPRVYPQERTRHLSEAHTADHNRTAQSRPSKAKAPVVDDQDDDSFPDPPSFIFDLTPQRTPLMSVSSQKDSFPYEDSQNVATSTSEMLLTVTSPTATKHLSEPTTFTTSHSVVSQVPVVDDQTDSLPDPPAFILTPTPQRTPLIPISRQTGLFFSGENQVIAKMISELSQRHRLEVSTNMANHSSMAISGPTQAAAVKDQDNSFQKLTSLSFPPKPQSAPLKSITKQTELVLEEGNQNVAKTKMNSPPRVYPQERTRHLSEAHTADHNRTAQSRPSKAKAPVVDDQDDDSFPDPPSFIFDLTPQRTPLMSVSSQKDSFPYEDSQNVATSTSEMLLTVTSPTATKHLSEPTTFTTSHSVVSQVPVVDDQTDSLPDPPAFILTPTPQRTPLIPVSRQTGLFFSGQNQVIAKMISELAPKLLPKTTSRRVPQPSTITTKNSPIARSAPTHVQVVNDQNDTDDDLKRPDLETALKSRSLPYKNQVFKESSKSHIRSSSFEEYDDYIPMTGTGILEPSNSTSMTCTTPNSHTEVVFGTLEKLANFAVDSNDEYEEVGALFPIIRGDSMSNQFGLPPLLDYHNTDEYVQSGKTSQPEVTEENQEYSYTAWLSLKQGQKETNRSLQNTTAEHKLFIDEKTEPCLSSSGRVLLPPKRALSQGGPARIYVVDDQEGSNDDFKRLNLAKPSKSQSLHNKYQFFAKSNDLHTKPSVFEEYDEMDYVPMTGIGILEPSTSKTRNCDTHQKPTAMAFGASQGSADLTYNSDDEYEEVEPVFPIIPRNNSMCNQIGLPHSSDYHDIDEYVQPSINSQPEVDMEYSYTAWLPLKHGQKRVVPDQEHIIAGYKVLVIEKNKPDSHLSARRQLPPPRRTLFRKAKNSNSGKFITAKSDITHSDAKSLHSLNDKNLETTTDNNIESEPEYIIIYDYQNTAPKPPPRKPLYITKRGSNCREIYFVASKMTPSSKTDEEYFIQENFEDIEPNDSYYLELYSDDDIIDCDDVSTRKTETHVHLFAKSAELASRTEFHSDTWDKEVKSESNKMSEVTSSNENSNKLSEETDLAITKKDTGNGKLKRLRPPPISPGSNLNETTSPQSPRKLDLNLVSELENKIFNKDRGSHKSVVAPTQVDESNNYYSTTERYDEESEYLELDSKENTENKIESEVYEMLDYLHISDFQ